MSDVGARIGADSGSGAGTGPRDAFPRSALCACSTDINPERNSLPAMGEGPLYARSFESSRRLKSSQVNLKAAEARTEFSLPGLLEANQVILKARAGRGVVTGRWGAIWTPAVGQLRGCTPRLSTPPAAGSFAALGPRRGDR